jgi:hypothetical protein
MEGKIGSAAVRAAAAAEVVDDGVNTDAYYPASLTVVATEFSAPGTKKISWPFATGTTGFYTAVGNYNPDIDKNGFSNVYARLNQLGYYNATAVINDAVRNYSGVTFTFHTAAENVVTDASSKFVGAYQENTGVNDDGTDKGGYGSFGENTYYNYYKDYKVDDVLRDPFDPDVMWNNAPVNYTLFTGGLVINSQYTMQLTDTEIFSVGDESITFDYETLKTRVYADTNYYLDMILSMSFHTSVTWFWDSLVVNYEQKVSDTADSDAGTTGEDDILEDPTLDEDLDALDEVPDEIVPEIVETPEVIETPVVANPETGNAPIALAVIPVALAAAAIIAKKRK